MYKNKPAKLLLKNGELFEGYSLGAIGITMGEACFNTGMTGYQEILTDPSYCGQLITMTYPHIGNYGINSSDIESNNIHASGFIIKEDYILVSNYRSEQSLQNYLESNQIIGIQGIDTRKLTRILRDEGSMNAIISSKDLSLEKMTELLNNHPNMEGLDLAKQVTCNKPYYWSNKKGKYKVAAIDYGIKFNILRLIENEDCCIKIFPATSTKDEILKFNPDGIFLSNGPGDPAAVTYAINTVKELLETNIPIFGICLGHQILALAMGATTYKLKFGHRGCNHPVKNLKSSKIEITSQNHGFAIDNNLPKDLQVTHQSLNDFTIEGIKSKTYNTFSIQYHPESSPGPHDSRYLFMQFSNMMKQFQKSNYAKTQ